MTGGQLPEFKYGICSYNLFFTIYESTGHLSVLFIFIRTNISSDL